MKSRWAALLCAACCSAWFFYREESGDRLAGRAVSTCGKGAIVAVIGLELAGVAAGMAVYSRLKGKRQTPKPSSSLLPPGGHGFRFRAVSWFPGNYPDLIGVLVGYALSFAMGIVDTSRLLMLTGLRCQPSIRRASSVCHSDYSASGVSGYCRTRRALVVTANIVKKDLLRDPGLHLRCLLTACRP